MKILIDMNLSPEWIVAFASHGMEAVHWSAVGDPRAEDREIMAYASGGDYVVFTHDLDFGTMLALTNATGPSVIQLRTEDILPDHASRLLFPVLETHSLELDRGALITVDERRARVRILPLEKRS